VLRQYELIEKVRSYDPDADEGLINRAYVFSMKAHGDQQRASGDPYFSHPIEVAGILTELKLDDQTIATAILHDTIEDTLATPEEIEKLFGKDVARLVDGVTKLSKIEAQSENERAAENLRKFLLALSDDIRVLLVKLADRLHNMRTLHHIPSEEKRRRIARETMDIYAPLAERIGMYEMMTEMQTLAFRELEPDAYASITRRLKQLTESGGDLVNRIGLGLQLYLADNGLEAEVTGRQKHPYSIWKKMAERHISFEQLSDVMAFRIIVKDVTDCYRALGLIHRRWPMVPGRFKDYISTPKRNGYQSLHTSVIHDSKMRIEIQIRDRAMHELAERGLAAPRDLVFRDQDREVGLGAGIADHEVDELHVGVRREPRAIGVGVADCRRQADTPQARRELLQPRHGQRQEVAALLLGEAVELIDDDGLQSVEHLRRLRIAEQQAERLGSGQQHLRRLQPLARLAV
jgi:(p)ppGpp synthase/HD superfamily hydrolase